MSNYDAVREIISLRIHSRVWPPGFRLPSTKALAAEFDCGETLINNVMRDLMKAGLIVGRAGLARFVAGSPEDATDDRPLHGGSGAS